MGRKGSHKRGEGEDLPGPMQEEEGGEAYMIERRNGRQKVSYRYSKVIQLKYRYSDSSRWMNASRVARQESTLHDVFETIRYPPTSFHGLVVDATSLFVSEHSSISVPSRDSPFHGTDD